VYGPSDAFLGIPGESQKKSRVIADLFECYGGNILGRQLSYEEFVGLYVNRQRAIYRRSFALTCAIGIAFSGNAPQEWCEAQTDSDSQADRLRTEMKALHNGETKG
jgi:hypothetical protein